jgi:hypothetical protein
MCPPVPSPGSRRAKHIESNPTNVIPAPKPRFARIFIAAAHHFAEYRSSRRFFRVITLSKRRGADMGFNQATIHLAPVGYRPVFRPAGEPKPWRVTWNFGILDPDEGRLVGPDALWSLFARQPVFEGCPYMHPQLGDNGSSKE